MKACYALLCGALLALCTPVLAQVGTGEPLRLGFYASSEMRSYGLLIVAPRNPSCPVQRYLIEGGMRPVVANAAPLGGLRVVALGAGFMRGDRRLTVTALGCAAPLMTARRVIFGAPSPSHSWRAKPAALADVERHALRQGQG